MRVQVQHAGAGHVQIHASGTPRKAPKLGKPLIKSLNFNQYAALLDLYSCEDEGDAGDWLEHVQQLVSSFSDEQIELFSHIN